MRKIPIERLKELVYFDGVHLRWLVDVGRWGRVKAGTIAEGARKGDGYLNISLPWGNFLAHRVIWALEYGEWPVQMLDHINGVRTDNRIANLREVCATGNAENKHFHQSNNSLKKMGVTKHPDGRFRARICVNGKTHHIGLFDTPELAHAAYLSTKRILHAHCAI